MPDPADSRPSPTRTKVFPNVPQWHKIDETKVQIAGIRKLESKRLVLYTDLPSSPEIDDFPQVFDQAFDLWCQYFGLNADDLPEWRMRASLIDDPARFKACGLLPADLPKFLNGFSRQNECWLYNQTSPYYRRHLLLHEGVHGFMFTLIGRNAPPWYMEGMAELLGTHRWQDGKLELPYFPEKAEEVPKLGRIEIVQKDFADGQAKQFLTCDGLCRAGLFESRTVRLVVGGSRILGRLSALPRSLPEAAGAIEQAGRFQHQVSRSLRR